MERLTLGWESTCCPLFRLSGFSKLWVWLIRTNLVFPRKICSEINARVTWWSTTLRLNKGANPCSRRLDCQTRKLSRPNSRHVIRSKERSQSTNKFNSVPKLLIGTNTVNRSLSLTQIKLQSPNSNKLLTNATAHNCWRMRSCQSEK